MMTNDTPQQPLCECGCGLPAPVSRQTRKERGQTAGMPVRFVRGHANKGKQFRSLRERFESYVHHEPMSGCHLWAGASSRDGYGHIGAGPRGGGIIRAHRAAWNLYRGDIPDGLSVLHSCDNRSCVNPDHLWLGTQADNAQDMVRKGRDRWHNQLLVMPDRKRGNECQKQLRT